MKRKATKEEIERYNKSLAKSKEKYERDKKAGGVSCGHYVRLHDRWS